MGEVMQWAIVFSEIDSKKNSLIDDVRLETQKAQTLFDQLLNSNFKIFPRRLDLKIAFKVSRVKDHVEHVKGLEYKEQINFVITAQEVNHDVSDAGWMYENNIRELFEIVCDNKDLFIESPNFFSGRIHTSVQNIRYIVLDIMVDLLFGHCYKTHTLFKPLFAKKKFTPAENKIISKSNFLSESSNLKNRVKSGNINYTFSFINRGKGYNNIDRKNVLINYNLEELNRLWLEYFQWIVQKIDNQPANMQTGGKSADVKNTTAGSGGKSKHGIPDFNEVRTFDELCLLVPSKRLKQINMTEFERNFNENVQSNERQILLILIKSVIGSPVNKKNNVLSMFRSTTLNATRFIDITMHHTIAKLSSHVFAVYFILKTE